MTDTRTPTQVFVDEFIWRDRSRHSRESLDRFVGEHAAGIHDAAVMACIALVPEAAARLEQLLKTPRKLTREEILRRELDRRMR